MNVSTTALAQALETWAAGVTTFNSYPEQPTSISKALPLVICEIQDDTRTNKSVQIPGLGQYQQALVRARAAELLLCIDPEPSWTASQALYAAVDALAASITDDQTLGGVVMAASKFYDASYTPPEREFADGTVARAATFRMYIGELVKEV
jgi:hypothetical protein